VHFSGRVWWSFTVTIDRYRHMNLKWGPSLMEDQIIIIWGQYSWHHCTLLTGERAPDSLTCINRSRSVDLYKSLMKCVKQKQAAFPDARLDNELDLRYFSFTSLEPIKFGYYHRHFYMQGAYDVVWLPWFVQCVQAETICNIKQQNEEHKPITITHVVWLHTNPL